MTLEEQLRVLANQQCPQQVNVVDGVMSRVMAGIGSRVELRNTWLRSAGWAVAAAIAAVVVTTVVIPYMGRPSNEEMVSGISQLYDYTSWNTVENAVPEMVEYLYMDEESGNL